MCNNCFRLMSAKFSPFCRLNIKTGTFRSRVWPVYSRPPRARHKRLLLSSPCNAKWNKSMEKAINLEIARRWMPLHPLERQWDRVNEACLKYKS